MMLQEQSGETITSRDLQRVMAARRALREYAPYEPPCAGERTYAAVRAPQAPAAAPMTERRRKSVATREH